MAVLLPHSIFFHIPKTGGTWVRAALQSSGVPACEVGNWLFRSTEPQATRHAIFHADTRQMHAQGRFTFAFVRHPLTWYQSQWAFQMKAGWQGGGPLMRCRSENFQEFVRRCTEYVPGFLSRLYRLYNVDFMGRYEFLADDLVRALSIAREDFSERVLRATPPVNVRSRSAEMYGQCQYTEEVRALILESEWEAIEKYGYSEADV